MLIAEIGNNHEGLLSNALRLIDLAAPNCDAVKFQIFEAETLVHPSLKARVGDGTQLERLKKLQFSDAEWFQIIEHCQNLGVEFMATCFSVELLRKWEPHLKRIKIASGDNTYAPLLKAANETGKPVLVSTGGASTEEIHRIKETIHDLTLLHCVSRYPCTRPGVGRIRVLKALHGSVGYSCHTPGIEACYAAAILGASVIEKHFTDERRTFGDHIHSALPQELKELRQRMSSLIQLLESDKEALDATLRRGAYTAHAIKAGESVTPADLIWLRPGHDSRMMTVADRDYSALEPIGG